MAYWKPATDSVVTELIDDPQGRKVDIGLDIADVFAEIRGPRYNTRIEDFDPLGTENASAMRR